MLGKFCMLMTVFKTILFFSKKSFRNIARMSNSLDPDQARRNVGPVLDRNSLDMISAHHTSRQKVHSAGKELMFSKYSKKFDNEMIHTGLNLCIKYSTTKFM